MATITADDILDLVADEAPVERADLKPEATLDALGIASLDVISVLFAIEDKFGVVVEQEDIEGVSTLQSFVDAVLAKAKKTAPAS
jgi:acyl carrier protein